ncbi:MAG: hypothetical protein VYB30_00990 [Candidatus Thermoplasmatota archaeon]|nr:hypothetical protein [Candidatus Thermoplasmatota archaeon]
MIYKILQDGLVQSDELESLQDLSYSNLRTNNIPGQYNFSVERLIANRFQIGLSFLHDKLSFPEIDLDVSLIEFLRAGGFDESEAEYFLEDFLIRLNPERRPVDYRKNISMESSLHQKISLLLGEGDYQDDDEELVHGIESPTQNNLNHNITFGVTIGCKRLGERFLQSLFDTFSKSSERLSLVICCFKIEIYEIENLLLQAKIPLDKAIIIGEDWGYKKANEGVLGKWYVDESNQSGVPFGRAILHRALYEFSMNDINWILDDDMVFNSQNLPELNKSIHSMQQNNQIVGIGTILGDAPLPSAYIIRTQTIDFFYASISKKVANWEFDVRGLSIHDVHHDLSTTRTDHLEIPLGLAKAQKISLDEWSICSGKSLTRPIHSEWELLDKVPTRGGNTLILDKIPLIKWPNVAPNCGGFQFRRGDTVWARLIEQESPEIICPIPLALIQSRLGESDSLGPLNYIRGDIFGSMFTRAIETKSLDSRLIIFNAKLREARLIMNLIRSEHLLESMNYNKELLSEINRFLNELIDTPYSDYLDDELNQFILEQPVNINKFRDIEQCSIELR